MKTISRILILFIALTFAACQGEEGPIGPPGEDGINILGSVYEIQGTFNSANDFSLYYQFPDKLVDGDIVMVYILWEQTEDDRGNVLDVWRPLPQTIFLNEGALQYNFDYTLQDVQIYIEGTINPAILVPGDLKDQIFRIAVIPADLAINKTIDLNNYNAVMKNLNLKPDQIKNISAQKPTLVK